MATQRTKKKEHSLRGADKKEAFHREAESRRQAFSFDVPGDLPNDVKAVYHLAQSDLVSASVQIIPQGGDNNLHYHPGEDGFWMVLKGRVRFYGPEDTIIGDYGAGQGILMPRNARYWFESADRKQEAHLLHVSAKTQQKVGNKRVNVEPANGGYINTVLLNFPEGFKAKKILD
jgi:quercetin dioxygenase-like cupin family protein